jgi:hypothetical protein
MKRKLLSITITALLAALAGYSGNVIAAKGSPGPPPGVGGGGGGGEETAGNNLSLPTKFIPSATATGAPALRIACGAAKTPGWDGVSADYQYDGSWYWTQKSTATWSAECQNGSQGPVSVMADWGDNLTGEGKLSAGKPIRVEMRLIEVGGDSAVRGWEVIKLTPDLDDRVATYGTKGDQLSQPFSVFDSGAKLRIEQCADSACSQVSQVIYDGLMSAEVNSTGAVVYGFNWGTMGPTNAPTPGDYRVTFSSNWTAITGVADPRASVCVAPESCSYLYIKVGQKGGGGGGKPGGGGGGPPTGGGGGPRR